MLSGLTGAAITKIRIEGVAHEFSTIPGVKEDVVDIILNVKGLEVRGSARGAWKLSITRVGPGEVTAADIELKAERRGRRPRTHSERLEGGNLDMRLTVEAEELRSGRAEQERREPHRGHRRRLAVLAGPEG